MGLLDDAIREHLDLKRRRGGDPAEIERAEREALGPVRREPSMPAGFVDEGSSPAAVTDAPPDDFAFAEAEAEAEDFVAAQPTTVTPPEDDAGAGIAAPDYDDPEFGDFAAVEPPAAGAGLELEPAAPPDPEPEALFEPVSEPEPKPKRRHLFGRHRHDEDERPPLPAELPDDDPFDDPPALAEPAHAEPLDTADGEAVGRAQPISRDEPSGAERQPPALRITPDSDPGNTVEYDVEQAFLEEDEPEPAAGEDILEETPDFLADTPDHDRLWFEQKPPPDFDFDN
jgi:hypothetical protein